MPLSLLSKLSHTLTPENRSLALHLGPNPNYDSKYMTLEMSIDYFKTSLILWKLEAIITI